MDIELMSQFPIKGHVKKVVVRIAGRFDVELTYDGVTEYENAEIRFFFDAYEPIFLQSITVVQDEGADTGLPHGKCGDNLEYALTELPYTLWIWDSVSGQSVQKPALKLTFTGTGDMYNYDNWENLAPWLDGYREQIGEIELCEGMTRIGDTSAADV